MNTQTIFDGFTFEGISYYKEGNYFYADNGTIRERITLKEYNDRMKDKLIYDEYGYPDPPEPCYE